VFFEDASSLKSDLIIFIPGGDGHPVLKVSDLPLSKVAFIKRAPDVEVIVPLPILGHWLKKFWGFYYINSKLRKIPRLPGL